MEGPVQVGTTASSRASVYTFILVFQRYAASRDGREIVIPPGFVLELRRYLLETEITLDLDDAFHLRMSPTIRPDSSSTKVIYEFSTSEDLRLDEIANGTEKQLISVRYVRKSDNDVHVLNVRSGMLKSIDGHWMSGQKESTSTFVPLVPSPLPGDASELLLRHWFAPQGWLEEGRAVLVRPDDSATRKNENVVLCSSAQRMLAAGFTLLLVVGDLVHVELPAGHDRTVIMLLGGMMWRERQPVKDNHATNSTKAEKGDWQKEEPQDLAFIIAERLARRGSTGRKDDQLARSRFVENMYDWDERDIYIYLPGAWD